MSEFPSTGEDSPSFNANGPFIVKPTKKKQKKKPFVNSSNASTPSPPPAKGYHHYNGYRQFNGMTFRPNHDAPSHDVGNARGNQSIPLFSNPNFEVLQVAPVSSNGPPRRPSLFLDPHRRPPLLPNPPRQPPRFVRFPPPRPPPRYAFPPPRFPFPPPHPSFRLPFLSPPPPPSPSPPRPSTSRGAAPKTTHTAAERTSSKKVSFESGNAPPQPESVKPFKLSEKTRVHLQLEMQETYKRYEMLDPEESTWVPCPTKLWEKLGYETEASNDQQKDEDIVTPSTSSAVTQQQNTRFQQAAIPDAYQASYDIVIEDPFQKDANINYAERYPNPNFTTVRALRLFQPPKDDDEDDSE